MILSSGSHCSVFGNYLIAKAFSQVIFSDKVIDKIDSQFALSFNNIPASKKLVEKVSFQVGLDWIFSPANILNDAIIFPNLNMSSKKYVLLAFGLAQNAQVVLIDTDSKTFNQILFILETII